ncbi:hypothetical protein P691DRAFT_808638 [Macrolepiota fuliginosa MF-IS2]|uniref:Uncharacterized protein n=1 Tax=Macrolepiota fuliginosa MF-IS2 TaxID=1400762 RepID=A0A9P5XHS4_9AGAR|nr:hypothetical protein P691DRAFT_808638 [Macrolepiota fuliginosa MF-IS2]
MSGSTVLIYLLAGVAGGFCLAGLLDPRNHFTPTTRPSTIDTRDMLLSAARAHGWDELRRISFDSLSLVGNGTLYEINSTHDNKRRVAQFVLQVVLGILLRHQETVVSPGILQGLSASFVRTGHLFCDSASFPYPIDSTDTITKFITETTLKISGLVIDLIHHIEKFPEVGREFYRFSLDPTSWDRYTQAEAGSLSIEQIINRVPHTHSPLLARGLIITPGSSGSPCPEDPSPIGIFRSRLAALFRGDRGATDVDVEVGVGHTRLHERDIEYTAALFVAVLTHLPSMKYPEF